MIYLPNEACDEVSLSFANFGDLSRTTAEELGIEDVYSFTGGGGGTKSGLPLMSR